MARWPFLRSFAWLACGLLAAACGARTNIGDDGLWVGGGSSTAGSGGSSAAGAATAGASSAGASMAGGSTGVFSCSECEQRMAPPCQRYSCNVELAQCGLIEADGELCTPEDPCELGGVCLAGQCSGQRRDCSALDSACSVGLCDGADGQCRAVERPPGTSCDDGDVCTELDTCTAGSCVGTPIASCGNTRVVLDAVARGWWSDTTEHLAGNDNTFTGHNPDGDYNSYFVFDLAGVSGPVLAARLDLEIEYVFSADVEALSVWDVTTNTVTLEADGSDVGIFQDLQSGSTYASFEVSPGDVATVLSIELGDQALLGLNAALGGSFALGLHADTLDGGETEGVRFSNGNEIRIHQLALTLP